jgi:hypothetical protein
MSFALSILLAYLAFAGPAIIEPVKFDEKKVKEFQQKSCAASIGLARAKVVCPWVADVVYRAAHQLPHDRSRHAAAVKQPTENLVKQTNATEGAFCAMGTLYQTVETASTAALGSASVHTKNLSKSREFLAEWKIGLEKSSQIEPQMKCFGGCGSSEDCARKCKVNKDFSEFWKLVVGVPPDKILWQNPPVKEAISASAKERGELERAAAKLRASYEQWQQQLTTSESNAKGERKKLAEKYKCEEQRQKSAAIAQAASRSINVVENNAKGTGFYVKTKGPDGKPQYHFVTAQHVAGDADKGLPTEITSNTLDAPDANGDMGVYRAPVERGKYDRGNDVVSQVARKREGALEVVGANEEPRIGQEFQMSGHPGYSSLQYQSHTCTFQGYAAAYRGEETAYLMRCPSAVNTAVDGISGGPVTDSSGRVWGVNSAHYVQKDARFMIVAPISTSPSGALRYGLQRTFVSDHCVNEAGVRRRCQIIPGLTNATATP